MGRKEHLDRSRKNVNVAIVVVSDSRTRDTDESGRIARDLLETKGHNVVSRDLIGNESSAIVNTLSELTNRADVDVILTIGGTGISRRDITVDVLSPLMEKKLEGFGEMFRTMSFKQIGTGALMSRSTAGIINGKVVLCIPGSTAAVRLAVKRIMIPEMGHMVYEATR
ncbi:MAG TPA: molybdenum cofactor biosynthesis protein B [Thermoproteota archaeon]|nr:molybdenum cofactor biosynthesis protein B [Thermoproteota archaeon]